MEVLTRGFRTERWRVLVTEKNKLKKEFKFKKIEYLATEVKRNKRLPNPRAKFNQKKVKREV